MGVSGAITLLLAGCRSFRIGDCLLTRSSMLHSAALAGRATRVRDILWKFNRHTFVPLGKALPLPYATALPQPATQESQRLGLLNLKYDAMPAEYVTMVVTEFGMIPPTSVPVILREYQQFGREMGH